MMCEVKTTGLKSLRALLAAALLWPLNHIACSPELRHLLLAQGQEEQVLMGPTKLTGTRVQHPAADSV